ncbi:hypothetical protein ACIQUG_14260 [Ensifer sp. NPDC090286]|uniref:hypothetical protein n=1 Tax=Ensifer sp. NPDC090286 TaxID=3363991 RepID=UPI00383AB823
MTWASRIAFFLAMALASPGMATAEEAASSSDDLTILLRADKGALTLEYRKPGQRLEDDPFVQCAVDDRITLPAGAVVNLEFVSADVVYSFEVPGHVEQVDLVPGLINSRQIETPADGGEADGVLQVHPDGLKNAVAVRFIKAQSAFDARMLCTR